MIALEVNVVRKTPVVEPIDARIEAIVHQALAAEGADGEWVIAVVFVDDAEMREMHRAFMNIDEPTDIMTFPSDPDSEGITGGDLVISRDTAAAHAIDQGHSTAVELEFLIVHGMLHLLGWDDASESDRAAMLARQSEILAEMT